MTDTPDWLFQAVKQKQLTNSENATADTSPHETVDVWSVDSAEPTAPFKTIALIKIGADLDQFNLELDKAWLQLLITKISTAQYVVCWYSRVIEFLTPLLSDEQALYLLPPTDLNILVQPPLLMSRSALELRLPTNTRMFSSLCLNEESHELGGLSGLPWDGRNIILDFRKQAYAYTEGLRQAGAHGMMTAATYCRVFLPVDIVGNVHLSMRLRSSDAFAGNNVTLKLGHHHRTLSLGAEFQVIDWGVSLSEPLSLLEIVLEGRNDVGQAAYNDLLIESIEITSKERLPTLEKQWPIALSNNERSVIYCARLSAHSYDENLDDLISAFCITFRESPECTLLLLVPDVSVLIQELVPLLHKLGSTACRVQVIESDTDYIPKHVLETSDYLISPSAWPRTLPDIVRALELKKPVLSPALNGLDEYVCDLSGFPIHYFRQPNSFEQERLSEFTPFIYTPDWVALSQGLKNAHRAYQLETPYQTLQQGAGQKLMSLQARDLTTTKRLEAQQ